VNSKPARITARLFRHLIGSRDLEMAVAQVALADAGAIAVDYAPASADHLLPRRLPFVVSTKRALDGSGADKVEWRWRLASHARTEAVQVVAGHLRPTRDQLVDVARYHAARKRLAARRFT
jgi:hypothetical protein